MTVLKVLVTGATGYIGGRLVPELLAAGHSVVCLARTPAKLDARPWRDRVAVVRGDVNDATQVAAAAAGVDVAYYLVHSMDGEDGFEERDRRAAETFRLAVTAAGVARIVYLGGLGSADDGDLSPHLASRHEVGHVLADGPVPVTELRAALIIGSGSASFEMLRNLTEVLPIMTTPRWVRTRCQPIAIRDMLAYLVGVLTVAETSGRVLEVGGPDVLTYAEMMQVYATEAGLRPRVIVPVPVLSPGLSSLWVGLVTPIPSGLARPLVESLVNEVVVHDDTMTQLVPRELLTFRASVGLALQRVRDLDVATTWAGADLPRAGAAEPQPEDPSWSGGLLLEDVREVDTTASPAALYAVVTAIGGDAGYPVADVLWEVRGLIDNAVGGVGVRRGRRHPRDLAVGEALDFWRVEALDTDRLMRLRAEMKLPGEAWLEFAIAALPDGGARLTQSARFHPRGLWGRAYWYAMVPFHALIFRRTARALVRAAESSP